MRLKQIKLAGFKSFVDPTTVPFPGNLCAVLGPNGCGKSNVIDAVRWVMGESSAKNLRGESMTDVIFNGSSRRKPVGLCTVELVFENTEGRIGGEYAKYAELAIKRQVTREAQSTYFLNGTKCRRKDITDIFLGTGLGPRSYAIIEQGMISRLIESRPEELRVFLEEAASISKYKERRRETENRMKHTRENLERLADLQEELDTQLSRLKRQSDAARRYKALREQERTLKAQLLAIRWRNMQLQIQDAELSLSAQETRMEASLAEIRKADADLVACREGNSENTDKFNEIQGQYYQLGSSLARIEQDVEHSKSRQQQLQQEQLRDQETRQELIRQLEHDRQQLEVCREELMMLEPELEEVQMADEESHERLLQAEQALEEWQQKWDHFQQNSSDSTSKAEVEKAKLQHLEDGLEKSLQRIERLKQERGLIDDQSMEIELESILEQQMMVEEQLSELDIQREELTEKRQQLQQDVRELEQQLSEAQNHLQQQKGRETSLKVLQQAALGLGQEQANQWLEQQGLENAPRVGQLLEVESGWELAVETLLGERLEAVSIENLAGLNLDQTPASGQWLVESGLQDSQSLSGIIRKGIPPLWFDQIQLAENLPAAQQMLTGLNDQQSIITKDGFWLGKGWLRLKPAENESGGVLEREQQLRQLTEEIEIQTEKVESLKLALETSRETLEQQARQQTDLQQQRESMASSASEVRARQSSLQASLDQVRQRSGQLDQELAELTEGRMIDQETLIESRQQLEQALQSLMEANDLREQLQGRRENLQNSVADARNGGRQLREKHHQLSGRVQSLKSTEQSAAQAIRRLQDQQQQLQERAEEVAMQLEEVTFPIEEKLMQQQELLERRLLVEDQLNAARDGMQGIQHQILSLEEKRAEAERQLEGVRSALEQQRLSHQTLIVQQRTVEDQLKEGEFLLKEIIEDLPETTDDRQWVKDLESVSEKIRRLGAINLAAIEEYQTQAERKEYLDSQRDDLERALETLENAIRKIDKETRACFKETFDKVNDGLQTLFPKVFGGGAAWLELTGEDLLDTGVTIMARPPGKRNSTIHLLSGGEKALTAIALVFSIFQLNPAPFCMLDEVDAPLDDANVGRYCKLVKEMSEQVQFIYITHNKIAMEMASQLTGVTMQEPGVSRLVAVDVDQAVELIEH
ncbi:chromosome segregation protein SMC [Pelagibaculum spongiae]|uniref:Chromosome partition protein Smc n=1 Tax=Pelagibaculum spongiae TaxID=2080658 RepID=A0A2V1GR21_9GAMM|nr:chromosome segregation protein SMC [Pelagibaculum spongiae]PVZ66672.1 chromosome segregation protein SMC [Pelagibaculum spongiae]